MLPETVCREFEFPGGGQVAQRPDDVEKDRHLETSQYQSQKGGREAVEGDIGSGR